MAHFTPGTALIGGALIGLSASLLLLFNGRIAGITGIVAGIAQPQKGESSWRIAFIGGLLLGGFAVAAWWPQALQFELTRSPLAIVGAGLLVGFGTRMGGGCTSGHGICGLSRLSPRSLAATLSFMAMGIGAATLVTRAFGGSI
jgi:hypothetical protein